MKKAVGIIVLAIGLAVAVLVLSPETRNLFADRLARDTYQFGSIGLRVREGYFVFVSKQRGEGPRFLGWLPVPWLLDRFDGGRQASMYVVAASPGSQGPALELAVDDSGWSLQQSISCPTSLEHLKRISCGINKTGNRTFVLNGNILITAHGKPVSDIIDVREM